MKEKQALPPIVKDVGYFLRVFRAERGLSQWWAAQYFGINPSHWSLLEHQQRVPSPALAKRLSIATGAPFELLLLSRKSNGGRPRKTR